MLSKNLIYKLFSFLWINRAQNLSTLIQTLSQSTNFGLIEVSNKLLMDGKLVT